MKFGWGKTRVKGLNNNLETGYRRINWGVAAWILVGIVAFLLYLEIY